MINERFGKLVAIECVGSNHYGKIWKCKCDCGNEHNVVAARLKNGSIKSCGCSKNYENLTNKQFGRLTVLNLHSKIGKNTKWICKCDCGTQTIVKHDHLKSGHTQSCGCYNKQRIKETLTHDLRTKKYTKLTPVDVDNTKNDKVYWLCQCDCGNKCSVPATSLVTGNTKSCGCILKNQKGKNHPRWRHDITDEEREIGKRKWNTDEHKKWRTSVFLRDNYVCQISGQSGGQLVSHHIKSWNIYKNLRFDIKNGITMSRKLHIQFHRKYGYGNNNEFQLKEFINEYNTSKKC